MNLGNMKIKGKLLLFFSIVILVFTCALIIGIVQINGISKKSNNVFQHNVRPLETLERMKKEYAELRRLTTMVALKGVLGNSLEIETAISAARSQYDVLCTVGGEHLTRLEEIGESQENYNRVKVMLTNVSDEYWPIIDGICVTALDGDIEEMMVFVASAGKIASEINTELNKMFSENMTEAADSVADIKNISQSSMLILIVLGAIAAVISFAIAYFLGASLSKRIGRLSAASNEVANGDLNINLSDASEDELGSLSRDLMKVAASVNSVTTSISGLTDEFMAGKIDAVIDVKDLHGTYKTICEQINSLFAKNIDETLKFLTTVTEFGNGNFNADMERLNGDKVVMNNSLDGIRDKLKSVVKDIGELVESAAMGELTNRVDSSGYDGDWAKIMDSLNQLMDAVSTPISEAEAVLSEVSNGNFDRKITGDFKGEFLLIKQSVNNMVTNINSYIGEISVILSALAENNLQQSIEREYVGKFTVMKDAINNIIVKLNKIISRIAASSEQVASGAKQISESSSTLSEGTTEQAASVEELSATILTINQNTAENADNAKIAESLSDRSKKNAAKGDVEMKNMLSAMEGIKESSNSISKIIKVIDDIAFQTNLLALNAAVEGARAGVHGKGFAVVAEEVRNLASRSQSAAKETAQLIEESISRVNEGKQMADTTAQALQTIVEDVGKVAEIITGISLSSQNQASAIAQVSDGLTLITDVIQSNTSLSEEAASSSHELLEQSEMLKGLVREFKLK